MLHRRLHAGKAKAGMGTMAEERDLLNADLQVNQGPEMYGLNSANLYLNLHQKYSICNKNAFKVLENN